MGGGDGWSRQLQGRGAGGTVEPVVAAVGGTRTAVVPGVGADARGRVGGEEVFGEEF